jgi:hypothetical protein
MWFKEDRSVWVAETKLDENIVDHACQKSVMEL